MSATLGEIATRIGSVVPDFARDRLISVLLTDSRQLTEPESTIFFALHTHTGDGHFYLRSLYNKGVRNFIVERIPENIGEMPDAVILVVPNTLKALQQVGMPANGYNGLTIAVAGSRGKSIVKEWLYEMLSQMPVNGRRKAVVVRSPRSYNSQTGVPLSLWQVPKEADYAVIEAGISEKGEMSRLVEMVKPKVAILTGLDSEIHAAGFESLEQKAHEKALISHDAEIVVYNEDNIPLAKAVNAIAKGKRYFWSRKNPNAPLYVVKEERQASATLLILQTDGGEQFNLEIPFVKDSDVEDVIAVITTLFALGYKNVNLGPMLSRLKPVRTRLEVVEGMNGCTVAIDGYSSDMSSLPGALDFMRRNSAREQRLTLAISDLQGVSEEDYMRLAGILHQAGVERVIAVGEQMTRHAKSLCGQVQTFASASEMLAALSVADFSSEFVMVKSTPGDGLDALADMLAARKHETVLEVNLGALARNYASYKRRLPEGVRITAMVKASAYGMGSYEVARTLQDAGADYLAVAVLDEGLELRRRGITMPIMVMNPKAVNYRSMFANKLEPEIYSPAMLEEVIAAARSNGMTGYPVHIKLDTGMHRTGFEPDEIDALCHTLSSQKEVRAMSVFSHLATADCLDMDAYTLGQIDTFQRLTGQMSRQLPMPFMKHILNSAGMVRFPQYAFDMGRLGIGLYGVNTLPPPVVNDLEPVARLRTIIIALHHYKAGEAVGYGRNGILSRDSAIATLPIGYADGFNRRLGNGNAFVKIHGKEVPTIGNICMDQCMINVTGVECAVGDEVEIFASQEDMNRLADTIGTIPYEILTSISPRVKRLYFRE